MICKPLTLTFSFLQNITCDVEEIDASYLNTAMVSRAFQLFTGSSPVSALLANVHRKVPDDRGPHMPIVSAGPAGEE